MIKKNTTLDKESIQKIFEDWADSLTSLYRMSMGFNNQSITFQKIIETYINSMAGSIADVNNTLDSILNTAKSTSFNDSYQINMLTSKGTYKPDNRFESNVIGTDPKTHQPFRNNAVATVDTEAQAIVPSVYEYNKFKPITSAINVRNSQINDASNTGILTKNYNFYVVSNSPAPRKIAIELYYLDPITINSVYVDIKTPKSYSIDGIDYYDETAGEWTTINNTSVLIVSDTKRIRFDTLNNIKKIRIRATIYFSASTTRSYYGLNQGVLQKILKDKDFVNDLVGKTNTVDQIALLTFIFMATINEVYSEYTEYNNTSYFVGSPYNVDNSLSFAIDEDIIATTNGAVENYIVVEDINSRDKVAGITIIPVLPLSYSHIDEEIIFPDPNTKTAKTMFPVDSDSVITITENGSPLADGTDYTVDYNEVIFTDPNPESRYAISYMPIFVNKTKLFTINKESIPNKEESFSTINGKIDNSNNTITFTISTLPDETTLVVSKTYNGESLNISDFSISGTNIIINNFDSSAPSDINAEYTVNYVPLQYSLSDDFFYFFGPNNSIIVNNKAKERYYGEKIRNIRMYPLIIIRDINNQNDKFVAIRKYVLNNNR